MYGCVCSCDLSGFTGEFSISILFVMELSLEDDDLGLFITQTPSQNVEISNLLDVSLDDFDCGEVGSMHYSDISEDEGSKSHDTMETSSASAEYVSLF